MKTADRAGSGTPRRRLAWILAAVVVVVFAAMPPPAAPEQQPAVPEKLLAGGNIQLVNDLQAAADARLVFRQFRREFGRLDRFEEVDDRADAALVGTLTSDPDIAERLGLVGMEAIAANSGGAATTKVMLFVIVDAETNHMLYYDAVGWDTRANAGNRASHTLIVQRLKAMLDGASH